MSTGVKIISENRKARFDYHIEDTMEAGIVLTGSEVKSLRNGQLQLKDSYVVFRGNEAYLQGSHISEYKASSYNNHAPERVRKLLLHRNELDRLSSQIQEKGLTCVPLKMYFKDGIVKVTIAIAKGKSHGDKRQTSKKRDADREIAARLRRGR